MINYNRAKFRIKCLAALIGIFFSTSAYSGIFVNWGGHSPKGNIVIKGDSQIKGYEETILIEAISGDFRRNFCGGFVIEKSLDSSSAKLIGAAFVGTQYSQVGIDLTNDGRSSQEIYFEIDLFDVEVQAVGTYAVVDDRPIESVEISAAKVKFQPYEIDSKGNRVMGEAVEVLCESL